MPSRMACAKVNLTLRITGKRVDGYHLLDSLICFAAFGDRLTVTSNNEDTGIALDVVGPFAAGVPTDGRNLVLQAAKALAPRSYSQPGTHIRLEKNLPAAAGIGGGSADAAACLTLLNSVWNLNTSHDTLAEIALSLGADVPACLRDTALHMAGIGEILTPAPSLPRLGLLLVNDGTLCPTGPVFGARSPEFSKPRPLPDMFDRPEDLIEFLRADQNDLEEPAMRLHPSIQRVKECVAALPGCLLARMSGSGATVFGLFQTKEEAQIAAKGIATEKGWWAIGTAIQ